MESINKDGVSGVQTNGSVGVFEVRSSRIKTYNEQHSVRKAFNSHTVLPSVLLQDTEKRGLLTCDSAEVWRPFSRVSCNVSSKTVSNYVDFRCVGIGNFLK